MPPLPLRVLVLLLALAADLAAARIVEEKMEVPVDLVDAYGKPVRQAIVVTLFHDSQARQPYPIVVLSHGRAPQAKDRAAMGRARFPDAARWLMQFGFLVAVPTRVGYGVSGGEDIEDSGSCERKKYAPTFHAAATQVLTVLERVRERDDAAKDRAVLIGQSLGGMTSIAAAALQPAGVQGAINFAGGAGGNPDTRPENPCDQPALERLYATYGKTTSMPTLWIYSENDKFFGPTLPKTWFEAFKAAGGNGDYLQFPPYGDNGHLLFARAPDVWQPRVQQFLNALGYSR